MNSNRAILLAVAVMVLAALAAYHNTFAVPFLFDDEASILQNPSIQSFSTALSPPKDFGFTVSGRPLLNLSLALNHAISGTEVWSYHAVNLLIHTLAGLALFGLVRRTLLLPTCRSLLASDGIKPPPDGSLASKLLHTDALPAAFVIALLWTLHPLQTESVTYVIQRAESLVGLFYLLTLYCFVRAVDSPQAGWWGGAAIASCLIGTGCKEVIATVPVVALLYDRTFAAGSFSGAWRARRWIHAGLLLTWLPLAGLVISTGGNRGGTFDLSPTGFGSYWLTQFEAITRYLQLSLWPSPLIFEYGVFKVESLSAVAPLAVLVGGLLAATGWALWRRPVAGFLGACFWLILAPSSLVPGVTQVMAEHRMYLPLAAVLALMVGGATAWFGRRVLLGFAVLALVAGGLTVRRNADYQNELRLWQDTVQKRPTSAKAQGNLATLLYRQGDFAAALPHYVESLRLDPASAQHHYNYGLVLDRLGRTEEAVAQFREAVRILPYFGQAHAMLGSALTKQKHFPEAAERLQLALGYLPQSAEVHYLLGVVLVELGRVPEAIGRLKDAVRLAPLHVEARLNLGILLAQGGQLAEAQVQLTEAARLQPGLAEAHANLGIVLAELGRVGEAMTSYETALKLRPDYARAHYNLGNALITLQRWTEAKGHFAEAVRLEPDFAAAREMLERMKDAPDGP